MDECHCRSRSIDRFLVGFFRVRMGLLAKLDIPACRVWFIVFPFVYTVESNVMWSSIILGAVTVLLNLITLSAKD